MKKIENWNNRPRPGLILKAGFGILIGAFLLMAVPRPSPAAGDEAAFLLLLEAAYEASCDNAERLRDYYLPDAEIVHDGRQTNLEDTINELNRAMGSVEGLTCVYEPKVRSSRIYAEIAYLVIREVIWLSAHSMEDQKVQQICTYVFIKKGPGWKIGHDHCSTIRGEAV